VLTKDYQRTTRGVITSSKEQQEEQGATRNVEQGV